MRKVWIEAALNGPWSRALQPGIPDTIEAIVAEGIACAEAGAAIIHTHAYDGGGPQTFDWQVYARIIEGIRAKIDVPVYPSIPGLDARGNVADPKARFAHIERLAERGLLEFAVVDPGSVNFTLTRPRRRRSRRRPISIRRPISGTGSTSPDATASTPPSRSTSRASSAPAQRWRARAA
ncbi:3-keto-5-aminohexanoate cleavage protein [Bradyrhizobium sp. B117]|uniref:3-keto-5-aminohexanoate cleavage protein n=1 Tax=Bradyrhizobium sp. B117 TaxID=3140246 RepID=UPI003182D813